MDKTPFNLLVAASTSLFLILPASVSRYVAAASSPTLGAVNGYIHLVLETQNLQAPREQQLNPSFVLPQAFSPWTWSDHELRKPLEVGRGRQFEYTINSFAVYFLQSQNSVSRRSFRDQYESDCTHCSCIFTIANEVGQTLTKTMVST